MDDAGAVIISSRKYCFYQTGVDRRNRISTLWPCKRHRKRETFVRFQHFLSHPFIWFSILSESVLSSHSSSWIGFTGQSKWHEMSIVASCRRDVRASYAQGGCFVPGPVYEVLFFNFFFWNIPAACVIYNSRSGFGGVGNHNKKPWHSLKIDAGCVRRTKALILPGATSCSTPQQIFSVLKDSIKTS